jgi:hypothetical protein
MTHIYIYCHTLLRTLSTTLDDIPLIEIVFSWVTALCSWVDYGIVDKSVTN